MAVLVAAAVLAAAPHADATLRQDPQLSDLSLPEPAIHAVGVTGTGLPKQTHLLLTLSEPSLVRIRVKDTDPYGLSRAFNVDLPAGAADVPISARVDGTSCLPGGTGWSSRRTAPPGRATRSPCGSRSSARTAEPAGSDRVVCLRQRHGAVSGTQP